MAVGLAEALGEEPDLSLERHVAEQYGPRSYPFFVLLADGRTVTHGGPIPEPIIEGARARLRRGALLERPARGAGVRGTRGAAQPRAQQRTAPIVLRGRLIGVVVVPPQAPFGFLLGRYAPTLAVVGGGVLIVGALLAAVIIFGPAPRRLREVEDAARRLGAGDLTARAPVRGGDEVAAVGAAFNAMAEDLAARAAALAAADRARRQLLADVSHELTTPVTAMRGYLETLAMPEFEVERSTRTRYLTIISDEVRRLERIIGDLLDLARLEGGGGTFALEAVPVAELFARVAARHERACRDLNVKLTTVTEPGADLIQGDRGRLEQALQNLAANAIRYAPPGTIVDLRARPADGGVAITVSDQGAGIAAEHLPHVFDRFYKTDSSRATHGREHAGGPGSGLGLSIVKAIVQRHGASISVSSQPGRTRFEITRLQLGTRH